jgi:hypothetical protein
MKSGSKVTITRRTDEDGKDQDFLYFDVKEGTPAAPAAPAAGATPAGESSATADSGARTT